MKRLIIIVVMGYLVLPGILPGFGQSEGPSKQEMDGAEYRLKKFEDTVQRARGKPFKLRFEEEECLRRVKALAEKYPANPQVKGMFDRARVALMASKGDTLEITPEMLTYRTIGDKIKQKFAAEADKEWEKLKAEIAASKDPILKTFPRPDPRRTGIADLANRWIIVDSFEYPMNEFTDEGHQYVFLGAPSTGFYFFDLSTPGWGGAYEAVRRYRRDVGGDLPENMKWTVAGKITSVARLIPQAGTEKLMKSQMGWLIEPMAIYIPGFTLTRYDPDNEKGGYFAAEDRVEQVKSEMFSVTSVPTNAKPEEVVAAYITAIKEKNFSLFMQLIDPARLKTPKAVSLAEYHWELHQHRWATYYVHAVLGEPEIELLKGFDAGSEEDVGSFFLNDSEKAEISKHSEPTLEQALIWVKFYDERGRQVSVPSPCFLRRYAKERWVIESPSMPN